MDQQHTKEDLAAVYNKVKELAEFLATTPSLSGGMYFSQFGFAVAFGKGATEDEARKRIAEKSSKPF